MTSVDESIQLPPGERLFDVFGRSAPGKAVTHLGSVAAWDQEFAQLYATQLFGRRGENQDIAIAARGLGLVRVLPYSRTLGHHSLRTATVFKPGDGHGAAGGSVDGHR
jgi:hypothetical protein